MSESFPNRQSCFLLGFCFNSVRWLSVVTVCKVSWDSFSWLIVALVGIIATRTTGDEQPGRGQMDSLSNKINQDQREPGRGPMQGVSPRQLSSKPHDPFMKNSVLSITYKYREQCNDANSRLLTNQILFFVYLRTFQRLFFIGFTVDKMGG